MDCSTAYLVERGELVHFSYVSFLYRRSLLSFPPLVHAMCCYVVILLVLVSLFVGICVCCCCLCCCSSFSLIVHVYVLIFGLYSFLVRRYSCWFFTLSLVVTGWCVVVVVIVVVVVVVVPSAVVIACALYTCRLPALPSRPQPTPPHSRRHPVRDYR